MNKAIVASVLVGLAVSGCSLFQDNGERKPNALSGGGNVAVIPVDPEQPNGPDGIHNSGDECYEIHVYTVTTGELALQFPKSAPMMGWHASALIIGGGGGGGAGRYNEEPGGPGSGGGAGEVVYIEDFVFEKDLYPVVIAGAGGAGIVAVDENSPSDEKAGHKGQSSSLGDVTAEGGGGGGSLRDDTYITGDSGGSSGGTGHTGGLAASVSRGSNGSLRTKNADGEFVPAVIRRFGNVGGKSGYSAAAGGGGAGSVGTSNPDNGSAGGGAGVTFQTLGLGKLADALRRAADLEIDGSITEGARVDDADKDIINVADIPELRLVVSNLLGGFGGGGAGGPRDLDNTEGTATHGGGKLLKTDGAFDYSKAPGLNFTGGGGAGGGGRAGTDDEHIAGFPGGSGLVIVWFYWQQLEEPDRIWL